MDRVGRLSPSRPRPDSDSDEGGSEDARRVRPRTDPAPDVRFESLPRRPTADSPEAGPSRPRAPVSSLPPRAAAPRANPPDLAGRGAAAPATAAGDDLLIERPLPANRDRPGVDDPGSSRSPASAAPPTQRSTPGPSRTTAGGPSRERPALAGWRAQREGLAEEDRALLAGLNSHHGSALAHLAGFLSEHGHGGLRGWLDLVRRERGDEAQRLVSTQMERLVSTPVAAERLRQALNILQERHIEAGQRLEIPIPQAVRQAIFERRQARGPVPVPEVPAAQRLSPAGAVQWFRTRVEDHDLIEHVYGAFCALAEQSSATTGRHRGTLYQLASHLAEAHAEDSEAPDGLMQFLSHREGADPERRARAHASLDAFVRQHPEAGSLQAIERMLENFSFIPAEDRLETSRRHEQDAGGFAPARMRWLLPPQDRALLTGLGDLEASRLLRFGIWMLHGGRGGLTEWLSMPADGSRASLVREYRSTHSQRADANFADLRKLCRAAGVPDDIGGDDPQPPGRPDAGAPAPGERDADVEVDLDESLNEFHLHESEQAEGGQRVDMRTPRAVGQAVFRPMQPRSPVPVPEVPAAQRLSPAGAVQWFRTRVEDHDLIEHVYAPFCALAEQSSATTGRHRGTLYQLASHLAEAHAEDAEAPDGLMQFLSHREGADPERRARAHASLDAFVRQHPEAGSLQAIERMLENFSFIPAEDRLETSRRHAQDAGGFAPARMRWLLPPQDRALLTGSGDLEVSRLLRFGIWLLHGGHGGLTEWLSMPPDGSRASLLREYRSTHSQRADANFADLRKLCRAAGVADDIGGDDPQPPGRPEAGAPAPGEPDADVEVDLEELLNEYRLHGLELRVGMPQEAMAIDEAPPRGRNPRSGMRSALPIDDQELLARLTNQDATRLMYFAFTLMRNGRGGLNAWLDLIRRGGGLRARELALDHVRRYPKQAVQTKGLAAVIRRLQEHAGIAPSERIELLDPRPVQVPPRSAPRSRPISGDRRPPRPELRPQVREVPGPVQVPPRGAPRSRPIPADRRPPRPALRPQDSELLTGFGRDAVGALSRFAIALSDQGGLSGWLDMLRRGHGPEAQQLATMRMERLASTPSAAARLRQALNRLQERQGIEAERRIGIPIPESVQQALAQARRARPAPDVAAALRLTPAGAQQWFRTRLQDHDLIEHVYAPFCTLADRERTIKEGRTALYRLASHLAQAHAEDASAPDGLMQFLSHYEAADPTRQAQARASLHAFVRRHPEARARHDIGEALGTLSSIPEEDRLEASGRAVQDVGDLNPRRTRWLLPPRDEAMLAHLPAARATRLLGFDLWLLQGGHGGLARWLSMRGNGGGGRADSLVAAYQAQHRLGKKALPSVDLEQLCRVAGLAGDTAGSTSQPEEPEAGWSAEDELDLEIELYLHDLDLHLDALDPGDPGQAAPALEQIAEPSRSEAVAVDAMPRDPSLDGSWLDEFPLPESLDEPQLNAHGAPELRPPAPLRRSNTDEMLQELLAGLGPEVMSAPSVDATDADPPPAPEVERLLQAMSRLRVASRAGHPESIATAARAVQLEPSQLAEFLGPDGRLRGSERVQTWLLGLPEAQREAVLRFQHEG